MVRHFKTCGRLMSLALIPGIACTTLAQQPVDVNVDSQEVIVRVGDDPAEAAPAPPPEPGAPAQPQAQSPAPSYWIGILGGDVSEELRAHLGLEGAGVLVREVVPDSPAAQAGIKKFDVLLTANGKPVTEMATLAGVVREVGGAEPGEIKLDLLRAGGHQEVTVVPAARPAAPPRPMQPAPRAGGFEQFFGREGEPLAADGQNPTFFSVLPEFRLFGPSVAVGGANVDIRGPGAASVQVQTHNGKSRVVVTQGDKTWEVDADDPESLEQLPPEVRPMVEGMLNGQGGVNVAVDVQELLPQLEGMFEGFGERWAGRRDERIRRRLELLERQIEQLRGRLGEEAGQAPPAADDEAPAFVPPPAPAAEIELPAEPAVEEPADQE